MERKNAAGHRRGMPGVLEFPCTAHRRPNGNTLIADAGDEIRAGSEIIEVDPRGQIVWNYSDGLTFAHSAVVTRDGNVLVADTTNDRVVEISRDRQIVFSTDELGRGAGTFSDGSHLEYPNSAVELDDGTFLITDRNNDRCIILDRDGRILWSYDQVKRPHNAEMLDNGNVIIADSEANRIVEVARDKRLVWSYGDGTPQKLNWPRHARRLPDGNTLITDSKNARVLEVDADGRIAWRYQVKYLSKFYFAEKLQNGNVLISDQQHHQVFEVDPGGTMVWLFRNYIYPNPILPQLRNGSFEQRDDDGWPADWILSRRLSEGGGELIWDEGNEPFPCPGIAYDRDGAICLQQTVRVKPRAAYRLQGEIRTEALDGLACFQIAFLDALGSVLDDAPQIPRGREFRGTTDWTRDTLATVAPLRATAAEVRLFVTGRGNVWVRGLRANV